MGDLVKQDINFLDKPLWFQSAKNQEEGKVIRWEDIDGYVYKAAYKLPDKLDILFLFYMLLKSQQAGYKQKMVFTRYEIVKACGLSMKGESYKRLEDGLKKWKNVNIEFHGTFYDGKQYKTMLFGIVDYAAIWEEDKKIEIRFNKEWLIKIKESGFCKYIQFNRYKALKRPVSRRLFEILGKTFKGRFSWEIGLVKLGKKLTLSGKKVKNKDGEEREVIYASDVLRAIKPAINEINKMMKDKNLFDSVNLNIEDAFLIECEIKGKGNDRVIIFKKKSVPWAKKPGKTTVHWPAKEETPQEKEAKERAAKIGEARRKREEEEIKLWDKVNRWIENHGGKERALYQGFSIVTCNPSMGGLVIQKGKKRTSIPLDQVEAKEFGNL